MAPRDTIGKGRAIPEPSQGYLKHATTDLPPPFPTQQAFAAGFGSGLLDKTVKVGAGNELEHLTEHAA